MHFSRRQGYSCAELKEQGLTKSGIYYLLIRGTTFWYIKVYCDMETANGGWTVSGPTSGHTEREEGRQPVFFFPGRAGERVGQRRRRRRAIHHAAMTADTAPPYSAGALAEPRARPPHCTRAWAALAHRWL